SRYCTASKHRSYPAESARTRDYPRASRPWPIERLHLPLAECVVGEFGKLGIAHSRMTQRPAHVLVVVERVAGVVEHPSGDPDLGAREQREDQRVRRPALLDDRLAR